MKNKWLLVAAAVAAYYLFVMKKKGSPLVQLDYAGNPISPASQFQIFG